MASKPSTNDSPGRLFLKRGITHFSTAMQAKSKKVKMLQQTVRRQKQKIKSLSSIIEQLKNEHLLNEDASDVLIESFGKHQDLITNWRRKNLGLSIKGKYSPLVRQLALSLHFYSSRAYEFVRKEFNTVLPHSRTLSKWYAHIDANPSFTKESLKMLSLKQKNSNYPIICSLEYDGTSYYGRVDLGNNLNTDSLEMAKECLVFMVVSVNENWKIPIGYFLTSGLNSSQKSELVRHALDLLLETKIIMTSLTYDGFSTNL
ncbi:uncharacterized protein LOC111035086 [Myzus persicae]|uniref:uncharacterized protein LOC111035086 n=1 Tax=Myzus persicae TaxID=13164 RepID=UPI000B9358B5|nr:uncharacterized protein LOC111035086 [Myzus persicae]